MKNLIIILIDALNADCLGNKSFKNSPSPFLDKIKEKSEVYNNVFSSAPYTEGAMLEFLGGYNTLDNESFMENLKNAPSTLFESFSKNGYDVYSSIYNYPNNEGFKRGVNYPRVMGLVYPSTLWHYRFKYYARLKENKQLCNDDYKVLINLYEECLENLKRDLIGLDKKTYDYSLMNNQTITDENIICFREYVKKYETRFVENKKKLIDEILDQGLKHDFYTAYQFLSWPSTRETQKIHETLKFEYSDLINKMSKLQIQGNNKFVKSHVKNTVAVLNAIWNDSRNMKLDKTSIINRLLELSIYTNFNIKRVFKGKQDVLAIKDTPCANTQFNDFLNWYDCIEHENKPFMSFLHLDDLHVTPIPYSYTSGDEALIRSELNAVNEYICTLDKTYRGNIVYDAAIFNLDKKLENFVKELDNRRILDDTLILFTSDHGFYYTYDSFRIDSIENVHRENYHILCMIYDKNANGRSNNDNLFAQKDIPVTILKRFDISVPMSFIGLDMAKSAGRDYNILEYPGRGCPDLNRKTLVFAAYDFDYKVYIRATLDEELTWNHVVEVYDLKNDKLENKNIVLLSRNINRVVYLFERIRERHFQLRERYK